MEKIKKITNKLIKIVKNATKIYHKKKFYEIPEKHKFLNDDVTNLDLQTQSFIIKECKKIFKDINIVGEEGQEKTKSNFSLIVDPIDGTFNFKHNIDNYGTQICLLENDQPIISVLYLPTKKKLFYANKFGAFENNKKIFVAQNFNYEKCVALVGDFVNNEYIDIQKRSFDILASNFKRIRMNGSSCVDNCMLASGKSDLYIIFSKNMWDLIPGQFLVKQAGGKIVYNKHKNIYISGNEKLVDKTLALLFDIIDY